MALKSVTSNGEGGLSVGESAEGYLVGTPIAGKHQTEGLELQSENGTKRIILGGNIKYAVREGKVTLGQYTVVTRVADRMSKAAGKLVAKYDISQDDERVIAVDDLSKALGETTPGKVLTDVTARVAALKANSSAARGKN